MAGKAHSENRIHGSEKEFHSGQNSAVASASNGTQKRREIERLMDTLAAWKELVKSLLYLIYTFQS